MLSYTVLFVTVVSNDIVHVLNSESMSEYYRNFENKDWIFIVIFISIKLNSLLTLSSIEF